MATPQEILQGMIDDSENQVETLDSQIDQIDALIDELEEKAEGIEDGLLTPSANQLSDYLDSTKVEDIRPLSLGGDVEVIYGSNYNNLADINNASITDWTIIDSTTLAVLYSYNGVNWDGDTLITKFVGDWNYGHDYLIHPLTTFDGTYGIYPNISVLSNAKATLHGSRTKIANTEFFFGDYV